MAGHTVSSVDDRDRWDRLVADFSGTPLLNSGWLESVSDERKRPVYLVFKRGGDVVGMIGGLEVAPSSNILDRIGMYRSLFFYSGIAARDTGLLPDLMSDLIAHSRKEGYGKVTVRSWDYPYTFPFDHSDFKSSVRDEYIIPVGDDYPRIRKRVKKTVRRYANQAERKGARFRQSRSEDLIPVLFSLIDQTRIERKDRGFDDYSHEYIPNIDEKVMSKLLKRKLGRFFYAELDSEIVSIKFNISNGSRAFGIYTGTNSIGYETHAGDFLAMKVLETLSGEGVQSLSIGGLPREGKEGLRYYKMSVGAEERKCQGGRSEFLQGAHQRIPLTIIKKLRGGS
ncbi:MAG: GNAT family N-acetyltransferase [Thermoplasmatota archaeon]